MNENNRIRRKTFHCWFESELIFGLSNQWTSFACCYVALVFKKRFFKNTYSATQFEIGFISIHYYLVLTFKSNIESFKIIQLLRKMNEVELNANSPSNRIVCIEKEFEPKIKRSKLMSRRCFRVAPSAVAVERWRKTMSPDCIARIQSRWHNTITHLNSCRMEWFA